jgi:uncharacterized protein
MTGPEQKDDPGVMGRLMAALGSGLSAGSGSARPLPPVERWNPPFCGDIDMRIARDGIWFYMGTPIGRPALVKLFSSVLKLEAGKFFLVTPAEKVGIIVEDAPFQAVEMACEGSGEERRLMFRSNVDEFVSVDANHGLRFAVEKDGGLKPYLHVRRGLEARLTRALTYDLIALGEVRDVAGTAMFGILAGGHFWPAVEAQSIEGIS